MKLFVTNRVSVLNIHIYICTSYQHFKDHFFKLLCPKGLKIKHVVEFVTFHRLWYLSLLELRFGVKYSALKVVNYVKVTRTLAGNM